MSLGDGPETVAVAHTIDHLDAVARDPVGAGKSAPDIVAQLVVLERAGGHRDHQTVAGADAAAVDTVDGLNGSDAGAIAVGDSDERFTASDLVPAIGDPLLGRHFRQSLTEFLNSAGGKQQTVRTVGIRGPAIETGIEQIDLFQAYVRQLRGVGKVNLAVDVHHLEVGIVFDVCQLEAIALRLFDNCR